MKELLKWLSASGVGGLVAGLYAFLAALGVVPAGVDPLLAAIVIAGVKRLVDYVVSKIPVPAP